MTKEFVRNTRLRDTLKDKKRCVELINGYYRALNHGGGFEGGAFDTFGTHTADRFTSDDLLACSLLNARIKLPAMTELLIKHPNEYSELLIDIDEQQSFINVDSDLWDGPEYPGRKLYLRLREVRGIGETRATKLLARKRPDLFPIIDSVVRAVTVGGTSNYWAPLSRWLKEDDHYWYRALESIRGASNHSEEISTVRVFDVIAWLIGTGKDSKITANA